MTIDFIDFLEQKHIDTHPGIIEDDLPDACDDWLAQLDADEWINFGDKFARLKCLEQIVKIQNFVAEINGSNDILSLLAELRRDIEKEK